MTHCRPTDIRAVLFDATFTLFYPHPPAHEVYARVGARFGSRLTTDRVRQRFRDAWRRVHAESQADPAQLASSEALERAMWRRLVAESLDDVPAERVDACFAELWDWFAEPDSWRAYAEAAPALDRLAAAGYELAVVSNFDSRLPGICRGLGLDARLRFVLTSAEAGWRKPDSRIFGQALDRLGCPAEQAVFVGDTWSADVHGARAAGLRPVWLRRRPGQAVAGVACIESLDSLPGLLDGL